LNIVTPTTLKAAPLTGRLNFPKHSLTWIVKGTFDLKANGPAVLSESQGFPTADEFHPGDEEKTGSVRYESDFAWLKPRADLLLVGTAHAPGGKPVPVFPATFRVGNKTKSVGVIGPRRWEKNWLTWRPSEPEPLTRLELRYENSFGGPKFPTNPVGRGFAETTDGTGAKLWPMPNLEDPAHLIESNSQRPPPAGFGPLNRTWAERHGKLGTYKGAYRKTRWPWFPEDFDWTHFNAAPPDMQLEGYLRGDESLVLENLHPQLARYESKLPGLRVRSFVHRRNGANSGALSFDEIDMKLDTLWVDMEAEKLVLVWRGWTAVSSEDYEEIQDIFYVTEPLTEPAAPAAHYHRQFLALQAAATKPFEPETPAASAVAEETKAPVSAEAAAAADATRKNEREAIAGKLKIHLAAVNAQVGVDKLSPEAQAQAQGAQAKLIDYLSSNDPGTAVKLGHDAIRTEFRTALGKLGIDPDNLPPVTEKAQAEQLRLMNELGIKSEDIARDPQLKELVTLVGVAFGKKPGMDPENLGSMIGEAKKLKTKLGIPELPSAPPAPAVPLPPLTREAVQARLAALDSFAGADLRGLDFSNLDLHGADFAGANLAGVPFHGSKLQQANFSKANLGGADFTAADLTQANAAGADFSAAKMSRAVLKATDLTGASLAKADLTKAVLDGAILEGANLQGTCFAGSAAIRANFARADLTGANFKKSHCSHADFTKAKLGRADFQEADLTEACLNGAIGHQLDLTRATLTRMRANGGCDLTGAKLVEVQGNGSMWKEANLTGADLRFAQLEETLFTSACLKQANFSAANLKMARFNKASLREAKLLRVNLFQGNLERADLTLTDLSGSNLYEAELLDAVFDRTVAEGANLKMTKLEPA
jgi:uncharacterized protein YjbI with pentapeptide repeats